MAGSDSAIHGHSNSTALYTVLSGKIREERYLRQPDGSYRYETAVLEAGQRYYLPAGGYHRVCALEASLTMHCYSPAPLSTTTQLSPEIQQLLEKARLAPQEKGQLSRPSPPDVVATAREFLDVWAEREIKANENGELQLPAETLQEIRTSGILAAPIPCELRGWGASLREVAEALRLIGQRAPATALALVMPLGNAATTRIPEEVVPRRAREELARGKHWIVEKVLAQKILAVANSEPGSGGELRNTRTIACQGSDGVYRLTGRKSFATFGRDADYFLCAARRRERTADGREIIDGFFVARDQEGLILDQSWNPVGMRPTASVGFTLTDCQAEEVLGYTGCLEGISARHWSTVLFAAVFLGVGEGVLQQGIAQVPRGAVWSRGTFAELQLELDAAEGFLEAVASNDRWPLPPEAQERTRRLKTFVARTAVRTAMQVAMVSGGRSYTPQHPVFRFLCDALAGPLLRPPLPQAMDAIVQRLFPSDSPPMRAVA